MIIHAVIFTWKAQVSSEQVEAFQTAFDRMAPRVPDIVAVQHGPDLRLREGNGDYAVMVTFADEQGWHNYQGHAAHKAFLKDYVTPMQASRVAIQITV